MGASRRVHKKKSQKDDDQSHRIIVHMLKITLLEKVKKYKSITVTNSCYTFSSGTEGSNVCASEEAKQRKKQSCLGEILFFRCGQHNFGYGHDNGFSKKKRNIGNSNQLNLHCLFSLKNI
jgi:hypothetical protein